MVEVDGHEILNQSDKLLEDTLNLRLQNNTKILVLRHVEFKVGQKKFGIIVKAIQEKQADVILLILRDCSVEKEHAGSAHYWINSQTLPEYRIYTLPYLLFATKKLILVNYAIRNVMSAALLNSGLDPRMPCSVHHFHTRFSDDKLPIVLTRHEFNCSKPFLSHYHAFIMALSFNCPEVSEEVRNKVVRLYTSWTYSDAQEKQWETLGRLIKCLNEGVPVDWYSEDFHVDIPALRQLDPLTLNKLTVEALYRLYFR